jgi:hypothetical protein
MLGPETNEAGARPVSRPLAARIIVQAEVSGRRPASLAPWSRHLGAVLSVVTPSERCEADYRAMLARFRSLSHLTIEVRRAA